MSTMKAVQIPHAGGDFELVERPIPEPGVGEVRVKVEACGICHSDAYVKEGTFLELLIHAFPDTKSLVMLIKSGKGLVTGSQDNELVSVGTAVIVLFVVPVAAAILLTANKEKLQELPTMAATPSILFLHKKH